MSEQEEFLARWMRLKQESGVEARTKAAKTQPTEVGKPSAPVPIGSESASVAPESLPAIESITGESDVRPFLQSGVPTELVRGALRAAWTTDPAIRDFVGIAECQWDFNDPSAMPGFGPLTATQSAQSVVKPSVSPLDRAPDEVEYRTDVVNPQRDGQVDKVWLSSGGKNRIAESVEVIGQATSPGEGNSDCRPRRHGSALPK
jgi:hypothetical protein